MQTRLRRALADLLPGKGPADDSAQDRGIVWSFAEGSRAVRGFHELHASGDRWSREHFFAMVRARLRRFEDACRRLNGGGCAFRLELLPSLEKALRVEPRTPWPFFGWKSEGKSLILTLYLADLAPSEVDRARPSNRVLRAFGLAPSDLGRVRLSGRLDCLGIALADDGTWKLRIYARFPRPVGEKGFSKALKRHGSAGGGHLAWWRQLESARPSRFWTQSVRIEPGAADSPLKTEIHFRSAVDPAFLLANGPVPDPWLRSALSRVQSLGGTVSCLAAEGRRAFVYFRPGAR